MESKDFIRINPDSYNADVSPVELGPEVVNFLFNMRPNAKKLSQVGGEEGFINYPITHTAIGGGTSQINSLPQTAFWIKNIRASTDFTWLIAGASSIQALTDKDNMFAITPAGIATGTYEQKWVIENFNSIPIFNRPIEQPYSWDKDVANRCIPLPGWPTSTVCLSMRAFKNYLIGLNVTDNNGSFPDQVIWSNAADAGAVPPDWAFADPTSQAGTLQLSDTPGVIIDGFKFKNSFLIYKTGSVYRMDFIGGTFVFSFSLLFDSFGAFAPNCVVEVYGGHIVFTGIDLVFHDGHQPRSLLRGRIKERFMQLINNNTLDVYKSFLFHHFNENEVWLFFITGSENFPGEAMIYNYIYDNFSFVSFTETTPCQAYGTIQQGASISIWDLDPQAWDLDNSLWGQNPGGGQEVHVMRAISTQDILVTDKPLIAPDKDATIIRETLIVPPERAIKFLYRVNIDIKAEGTNPQFTIAIGTQFEPEDPVSYIGPFTFTPSDASIDVLVKGRYFSYIINSSGQLYWELRGIGFTIKQSGEF